MLALEKFDTGKNELYVVLFNSLNTSVPLEQNSSVKCNFSFSNVDAIEVFQEGAAVLSRLDINGDFMAQVGIDARLNGANTVSLMYGKDQLR